MANYTITGKKNPGDIISIESGAAVTPADTLTVHGYRQTVKETQVRGLARLVSATVVPGAEEEDPDVHTTVFQLQLNPDKFNQ
jgi:hypothetical protein